MDKQSWPTSDCTTGGLTTIVQTVVDKRRIQVGTVNINHVDKLSPKVVVRRPRGRVHGWVVYQVTYRVNCGYGHYMLLFEDSDRHAYLFDSGDCTNFVEYERILRATDAFASVQSIYRVLGIRHRNLTPRCDQMCYAWTGFVLNLLATSGMDGVRTMLLSAAPERRRLRDAFADVRRVGRRETEVKRLFRVLTSEAFRMPRSHESVLTGDEIRTCHGA